MTENSSERHKPEVRPQALDYRSLLDSIDEGFCIIEVLFDASHHPVDYRFLEVNAAFENQTGLDGCHGPSACATSRRSTRSIGSRPTAASP